MDGEAEFRDTIHRAIRIRRSNGENPVTMAMIAEQLGMGTGSRALDRGLQALRRAGKIKHVRKVRDNGNVNKVYGWLETDAGKSVELP